MAWMPNASKIQTFSGNRLHAGIDKIVVHTTEGSSWPGYNGGRNAPHMTANPRTRQLRQHISTGLSSKALVNKSGGVQTNNDGCFQLEIIGSCDRAYAKKHGLYFLPNMTDDELEWLSDIFVWVHKTHGVPLTTGKLKFVDTNAAYETAPQRMSFQEWRDFKGVCGHQHVPENSHWDPGKVDVAKIVKFAQDKVNQKAPTKPKATIKLQTDKDVKVDGRLGTQTVAKLQTFLNEQKTTKVKLKIDGRLNTKTIEALQAWLGTKVDGEISSQSHKASSLGNGIAGGWDYDGPNAKGSSTIKALQKKLGCKVIDGVVGPDTIKRLQIFLNDQ